MAYETENKNQKNTKSLGRWLLRMLTVGAAMPMSVAFAQVQLKVVNGTGSGSYAAGTKVQIQANTPQVNFVFTGWTGATVASSTSASTTITMPSTATTVTANFGLQPTVPFPVTSHPRLWVTQADVPRLQKWAVSTNPVYENGMLPLLKQAVNIYQT